MGPPLWYRLTRPFVSAINMRTRGSQKKYIYLLCIHPLVGPPVVKGLPGLLLPRCVSIGEISRQ